MAAMEAHTFRDVEIRKLPVRYRNKISQLLDINDDWKKFMASIPSEKDPSQYKYSMEHITLVERHGYSTRKSCSEILLDEWSTSGRSRPTVQTLYDLLVKCQMFRPAEYVAEELLSTALPQRPLEGPARRITEHELTERPIHDVTDTNVESGMNNRTDMPTRQLTDSTVSKLMEQLNNYDYQHGNLINFSIDILKKSTKNFDPAYCVGEGSFGTVYKLELGPQYKCPPLAIKLLNQTTTMIEDQFVTEIRVLSRFKHENLVSLIGFCTNGAQFCLIYEFVPGGTLMQALAGEGSHRNLPWSKRMHIMNGIIKGIHYLHTSQEQPLVHRDIKSSNILLTRAGQPKIGDFGLAKTFTNGNQLSAMASTIFGTSAYMAPEAFRGDISPKMDIFSFGVIILELLTALPPYDESREGCDIVTYLEENVEDDDISLYVDIVIKDVDPNLTKRLFIIAQQCLTDKKRRYTSDILTILLQEFIAHDVSFCDKNL